VKLKNKWLLFFVLCLPLIAFSCSPAAPVASAPPDLEIGKDLLDHGLHEQSVEAFIRVVHHPDSPDRDKAEALYLMGQIAFDRGSFPEAMQDWQRLASEFPRSSRAEEVTQRMAQLYVAAKAQTGG